MKTTSNFDIEPIPGFDLYKHRRWLSISSLSNFARCPRLFFYSSGVRLRNPNEEALPLTFGSAIHAGLGYLLDGHPVSKAMSEFSLVWKDKDTKGDSKRNSFRAAQMFASFSGHVRNLYRPAPKVEISPGLQTRNSPYEVPFAIDIGIHRILPDGTKEMIPLVGWIDQVATSINDDQEVFVEYKTASEISTRFFEAFENSPQLCAYTCALRVMGKKIPRAFLTALRVSEKNTETQSHVYNITDQACDDFITWARNTGNTILAHEDMKTFPKDVSGCFPYPQFGSQGYRCRFHNLCHQAHDWTDLRMLYDISDEENFTLFEE